MEPWFIDYICEFGFGTVAVRVVSAGKSLVRLTANLGPKQEIGIYERELPKGQADRVKQMLDQANYQSLTASNDFPPDTSCITLGEGKPGGPAVLRCYTLSELPAALHPLRDHMKSVIEEIRKEPNRVLEGKAMFVKPAMPVGTPLEFSVVLKNIGIVPADIHHPAGAPDDDKVRLMLFIAKDKPPAELKNNDTTDIWLTRVNVTPIVKPDEPEEAPEVVELLPDDAIQLRCRREVHLTPGRYKGALTYHSALGQIDPKRAIEGALTMDLGKFEITK